MSDRVLVVGATGATGRRVLGELSAAGLAPVAAGRSQHALDKLAASHSTELETVLVDATHVGSVRAAMAGTRAVVSCIGPYTRYGMATAEAAASEGIGYVDMTGEPAFVHRLIADLDPIARDTGAVLVPAVAAMGCSGDIAAAIVLRHADCVDEITVGYRVIGVRPSTGTVRSSVEMIADGCPVFQDGWLTWVPAGANTRHLPTGLATTTVAPDPILINLWHPHTRIESFIITPGATAIGIGSRLSARVMARVGVRKAVARALTAVTTTRDVAADGSFEVHVSARGRFGWDTAVVTGHDIYGFSAHAGVQVVKALLDDSGSPGVNAPSQVLGDPDKAAHTLGLDTELHLAARVRSACDG